MIFKKDLIQRVLKATGVKEGEIILLHFWGEDEDRPLLHSFAAETAALGASPIALQQSRTVNAQVFGNAKGSCFDDRYFKQFEQVDAVIDIFMYQPVVLNEKLDDEHMNIYRRYMKNIFSTFTKAKRFVQLRVPTCENAKNTILEPDIFIQKMLSAYDINYEQLKACCENQIKEAGESQSVIIKTGESDTLFLSLEGRKWHIDAGDGDLPCGEVYIAPLEGSADGSIYFEQLYINNANPYEKIRMIVENGRITSSDNEHFNSFLKELPENGTVICEFGIGMNPNIQELIGYSVLDEKMFGTFHIAIGDNTMFGGSSSAPLHIDFVGKGTLHFV